MSIEKKGIAVSHGFCYGSIVLLNKARTIVEKRKIKKNEIFNEINRLQVAVEKSIDEVSDLKINSDYGLKSEHIDILDFNILILEDEILASEVIQKIKNDLINAEWALNDVLTNKSKNFANIKDIYMQERLADFYYIGERIVKNLRGANDHSFEIKNNSILVAHDLSPIDTLKYCQNEKVKGILTDLGGATSHTAIIARSLSIPAIMSLYNISHTLKPGQRAYVDGYKGIVTWKTNKEEKIQMESLREEYLLLEENLLEFSKLTGQTNDGALVSVKANIEITSELNSAIRYGAEGIGMYRTEFLFTSKDRFPTEDEQFEDYKKLLNTNHFDEATIRTLDIGGDKIKNLNIEESNPALGLRGIRYSLANIDIFERQLRAIFRVCAEEEKKIRILLPMISNIDEVIKANEIIDQTNKDFMVSDLYTIGVVIETPSAAILADEISNHVDFISIGTNDLLQYILAADRTNENLSNLMSYYQPSVIKIIKQIKDNVGNQKYISICGEMASDILSLPLFIGLGFNELSMNSHSIPIIKSAMNELSSSECKEIVNTCLDCKKAVEIEEILRKFINDKILKAKNLMKYEI